MTAVVAVAVVVWVNVITATVVMVIVLSRPQAKFPNKLDDFLRTMNLLKFRVSLLL